MGQYYRPTNIDKKKALSSHDYDNGAKLMEHSYIGNPFVRAVEGLLIEGGEWFKDRIVWSGDYADDEPESEWKNKTDEYPEKNLYAIYHGEENTIKPEAKELPTAYRYLVNFTDKEYVDLSKIKDIKGEKGWKIHPLPLLTCEGNGRGGGDFHGEDYRIGTWARKNIGIVVEKPVDYEEIDGTFQEE